MYKEILFDVLSTKDLYVACLVEGLQGDEGG